MARNPDHPRSPWARIVRTDGCWLWPGKRNANGYGVWGFAKGRQVLAHRAAWVRAGHELEPGDQVLHHCDNPPCVNPAHLFVGTQIDNIADMIAKGRARWAHLSHPIGVAHHLAKLDPTTVREVRRLHAAGISQRRLALRFGVARATLRDALTGRTWSHVGDTE